MPDSLFKTRSLPVASEIRADQCAKRFSHVSPRASPPRRSLRRNAISQHRGVQSELLGAGVRSGRCPPPPPIRCSKIVKVSGQPLEKGALDQPIVLQRQKSLRTSQKFRIRMSLIRILTEFCRRLTSGPHTRESRHCCYSNSNPLRRGRGLKLPARHVDFRPVRPETERGVHRRRAVPCGSTYRSQSQLPKSQLGIVGKLKPSTRLFAAC